MRTVSLPLLTAAMLLPSARAPGADSGFAAWHRADEWLAAGDATLDPANNRRLVGRPGTGVIVNGRTGKARSLVSKRRDFRDVELHVEFMVAKGSSSGVIFHGLYEIQILDSHHVRNPTAGHCGGIYPRAETKPKYHYIDKGSPPRVNAAKPPGEWQTYDIIFQSPRFDKERRKIAHAKFVRVTHNGRVIQENQEVKWATGTNWDRKQHPQGPIIIQGDYGPIALRNLRVRDWRGSAAKGLNVPPEGFTALFNGRDFTGWRRSPRARKMWSVEDGVLKAHGLLEQWGADLVTERKFRDFVLMADFRMPAVSDSGIHFRGLAPAMLGKFGNTEQFNIKADAAMGRLESFNFMTADMKRKLGLKAKDLPRIKRTAPKVGEWHTVKLTVVGKNLTAELDGEIIIDHFEYPEGILSMEPSAFSLQKHRFWEGAGGRRNPCPIEFRNIFIKESESRGQNVPPPGFEALFNGKDLTGWHTPPLVRKYWSVEDGVLKSPGLVETWGACLATKEHYRDFILMLDFRMPTISDSGINFRRLIPEIEGFGDMEQFNLRSRGGMGHLESYYFLPKETATKHGLKEEEKPHVRHIDPKVGVWHTVKLTVKGRTFSSEYDGEVLLDGFKYHDWMLNMEPAPIRLQKHIVTYGNTAMGRNLGDVNPCPIEYRNIFIKEIKEGAMDLPPELPLWERIPPGGASGAGVKEQLRSHKARPGAPSGVNRCFSCVTRPTYSVHRPDRPNGVGLVICPGGGFRDIWIDREGHDLAIWLKDHGVTSLVLKYRTRLPGDNRSPNFLQRYQRAVRSDGWHAVRTLRARAPDLGLRRDRIGICGFSAGGHLALNCLLRVDPEEAEGQVSGMPDFAGLFYPGIPDDAARLIAERSAGGNGAPRLCPMFIINARVDKLTPVDKCLDFYAKLIEAGVEAELHVFSKGSHGFDLGVGRGKSMEIWPTSFVAWLKDSGIIRN